MGWPERPNHSFACKHALRIRLTERYPNPLVLRPNIIIEREHLEQMAARGANEKETRHVRPMCDETRLIIAAQHERSRPDCVDALINLIRPVPANMGAKRDNLLTHV